MLPCDISMCGDGLCNLWCAPHLVRSTRLTWTGTHPPTPQSVLARENNLTGVIILNRKKYSISDSTFTPFDLHGIAPLFEVFLN